MKTNVSIEKQLKIMYLALASITILFIASAARKYDPDSITLTSPNGKNVITISAMNDVAGIWITNKNTTKMISIVNGQDYVDPFVGVMDTKNSAADCITVGRICLTDKNNIYVLQPNKNKVNNFNLKVERAR